MLLSIPRRENTTRRGRGREEAVMKEWAQVVVEEVEGEVCSKKIKVERREGMVILQGYSVWNV